MKGSDPDMPITGVHHTSFTVADLDRSVVFFRGVLGLELLYQREIRDEYFGQIVGLPGCVVKVALFRLPGSGHHLELFQYLEPRGKPVQARPCDPGSCHLSFLVDDLPALHGELKAKGVAFVSAPVEIAAGPNRGGYGIYLRDPNGILLEFFQLPRSSTRPS
jgi:catechol 2,3-dioxygenase-like lactoylglutathione lyase family enzyme